GLHPPVDIVGRGACFVGHDEVECVQLPLALVDGGQVLLEHVPRRTVARPNRAGDVGGGGAHGASPRIRGTRKRPSSAAGACARTSSRSSEGTGSSSRRTFTSGSG